MARFNELLGQGARISRGLNALLGLQEQEGVTTVAPELMPTISLGELPEYFNQLGGSLLGGLIAGVAAGGAGNRSVIELRNPTDANVLVILEAIKLVVAATEQLNVFVSTTLLAGTSSTGNLVQRDGRRITTPGFSGGFAARLHTRNNVPLVVNGSQFDVLRSTSSQRENYDIVLRPGQSVVVSAQADNTAIAGNVTFFVRERPAADRELIAV